ncbi:MAG: VWA domain-containing protein [Desulfobacteraceae bacterium]|nr:MAG: VWA domain-containing protein [Desulfobacteraceae bacterium]
MKKFNYCSIFFYLCLPFLLVPQYAPAASHNEQVSPETKPLYVVLLMDSSGSMKKTDPDGFRKLASQSIVSLLSAEDRIAIVEFDAEPNIISDWKAASERTGIFDLLNKIGNEGGFTDFRAGLEAAAQLFKKAPQESDKVIFLLSDGVFDPNPLSESYAPYNIQYRLAIRGKNKSDVRKINEIYRNILSPVAKRIIETNILPELKKDGVQVYCVGFSADADREFLKYLADESSEIKTESHYFYANKAIDLMETFVGLLHYWKNKIILKSEQGNIAAGSRDSIAMDAYLKDIAFIALTENPADFYVRPEGGSKDELILQGTHPNLKVAMLKEKAPPGRWIYGFKDGSGPYRLLAVGKSTLDLVITGIKEKYSYGEPLKANAFVQINRQDAREYLKRNPRVIAEIALGNSKEGPFDLQESKDAFLFEYVIKAPGKARIKFTLLAKDKDNNDLLPRQSKEFITEILPRFYVEPQNITYGDLNQGQQKEQLVKVHSGLDETVRISVNSAIKNASRCGDVKEKLPLVKGDAFVIRTGQSLARPLRLTVPEKGCWGDFEGEILFTSDKGQRASVDFSVHVPSIWEKLTWFAITMMMILAIILILLVIYWGYLKTPVGVLRPVNYPPGTPLLNDIKLSSLKCGVWNKFLHWKKNVITIGQTGTDLRLAGLPQTMKAELLFHRFGGDYIKNTSPAESNHTFIVCNPDVGIDIERRPCSSYQLSHGLNIKISDYEFTYEHIK